MSQPKSNRDEWAAEQLAKIDQQKKNWQAKGLCPKTESENTPKKQNIQQV